MIVIILPICKILTSDYTQQDADNTAPNNMPPNTKVFTCTHSSQFIAIHYISFLSI